MSALGEKLRKLRGDKTLQEVATAIGVNTTVISRYESGKRTPVPGTLKKLAHFYQTAYSELNFLACEETFSDPDQRESVLMWAKEVLTSS